MVVFPQVLSSRDSLSHQYGGLFVISIFHASMGILVLPMCITSTVNFVL
jgi:hypothetical protein